MRHSLITYITVLLLSLCSISAQAQFENLSADSLVSIARQRQAMGDAAGSFVMIDLALEKRTFEKPFNIDKWLEIVNLKANAYAMKFDWQKAIKVETDALLYANEKQNKGHEYAVALHNMATFHAGRARNGDKEKSINYARRASEIYSKRSHEYFICLNDMIYYSMLDRKTITDDARKDLRDAISNGESIYRNDIKELTRLLWDKSSDFAELDLYEGATIYGAATIDLMERNDEHASDTYLHHLVRLASYYYSSRDFTNEIRTLEKAMPAAKDIKGDQSREYVDCLRKLSMAYNHLAQTIKKENKRNQALRDSCQVQYEKYEGIAREILISTGRLDDIRAWQANLITNKAMQLAADGMLQEAIKYETIALNVKIASKDTMGVAHSHMQLATYWKQSNMRDSVLTHAEMAVKGFDSNDSISHHKAVAYLNSALYFHEYKKSDIALQYGLKSLKLLEVLGDTLSDQYKFALTNVGVYYASIGDDANAATYSARSSKIQTVMLSAHDDSQAKKGRKNRNSEQNNNLKVNFNMVLTEWNRAMYSQDNATMHDAYRKAVDYECKLMLQDFPAKSVNERRVAWQNMVNTFDLYGYANTLAFSESGDANLVIDAYDAMLIGDGVHDFIETGDSTKIMQRWTNIQSTLDDGTAYIRYFITETQNSDMAYSAILLRKGWAAPKVQKQLFLDADLTNIIYNDSENAMTLINTPEGRKRVMGDVRFGKLLWERVMEKLNEGDAPLTNIRYAPTGLLLNINPAGCCMEENTPMATKYNFTVDR